MKKKQKTPYDRILDEIRTYVFNVMYPKSYNMFFFNSGDIEKVWSISDVYERTVAANDLGYDVFLVTTPDPKSLTIQYRKRPPTPNWRWK